MTKAGKCYNGSANLLSFLNYASYYAIESLLKLGLAVDVALTYYEKCLEKNDDRQKSFLLPMQPHKTNANTLAAK